VASVVVKIKPASPEVLPALLEGLRTSDEVFKLKAILAMGDMGVNAKEAANALFDVAKTDPNQNIKNAAIRTLERIGPAGKGKDKE
jgi:HEAT repeat protein